MNIINIFGCILGWIECGIGIRYVLDNDTLTFSEHVGFIVPYAFDH